MLNYLATLVQPHCIHILESVGTMKAMAKTRAGEAVARAAVVHLDRGLVLKRVAMTHAAVRTGAMGILAVMRGSTW